MVWKLMESFDVNSTLLAWFYDFNPATLTVTTAFGDPGEQLDSVEAYLGIDQGWEADSEEIGGARVAVVGHHGALAMTLLDFSLSGKNSLRLECNA